VSPARQRTSGVMRLTKLVLTLLLLGLAGQAACQEDDYGEDDFGGGGGYGEEEEEEDPPPAPAGDGAARELSSVADLEAFMDDNDASVVGAFLEKEMPDPAAVMPEDWDEDEDGTWEAPVVTNPELAAFNSIASSLYNYRFAFSAAPDVLAKLKSKTGGLYLYRSPKFLSAEHGDKPRERFPSTKLSESAVRNWLNSKAQPLVGLYSSSTKERYSGATLVVFFNLDFAKNAKGVSYVLKRARKAAAKLKGKLAVAVASSTDLSYELGDYGLPTDKPNTILMGISAGGQYYAPADGAAAFSGDTMSEFARAFLAGELTPYEKPEPEPAAGGGDEDLSDSDDDYGGGDEDDEYKDEA